MKRCSTAALLICAIFLTAPSALADDEKERPAPEDLPWLKGYVQLGAFFAAMDSAFRIGSDHIGIGIELDVEEFLGLDQKQVAFRFDGGYRFTKNRRHGIDASWFSLKRRGDKTITEDVEIPTEPPTTLIAGTGIESVFDFDIFKVKYEYSFLQDERIDLNVGGGLYIMPIRLGLGQTGSDRVEESITAPLPVISLGFHFALTPKWFLRQDIDFMYLELSGFRGRIVDLNLTLDRTLSKHIGIGIGFETLDIEIDAETGHDYALIDFEGNIGFQYSGLQIYVKGRL